MSTKLLIVHGQKLCLHLISDIDHLYITQTLPDRAQLRYQFRACNRRVQLLGLKQRLLLRCLQGLEQTHLHLRRLWKEIVRAVRP